MSETDTVLVRSEGRQLLRLGFFFSVFTNLLMLTGPLFMLQVYDRVLASRSEETLVALFGLGQRHPRIHEIPGRGLAPGSTEDEHDCR